MIDLKELKRLVKYLRKEGITEFKNGDLEFKLGSEPIKHSIKKPTIPQSDPIIEAIESDYPSKEELLFYSAGGLLPESN